jgi:hypothetical protein
MLKTVEELEAILLAELRKYPQCEEAEHVSVYRLANERALTRWTIASLDPGKASKRICQIALNEIELRLHPHYDLAPEA